MLTDDQALRLNRFANGGDFDTDEEFFEAIKEIDSSEELHYLAQILNWDDYRTPKAIEQVLDHPKCDAGTALQIYWMNEPEGLKDMELKNGVVAAWREDGYQLHRKIEQLYLAGKYSARRIAFDPRKERYLPDSPERESAAEKAIPVELKTAVVGTELGEFYDRYKF